MRHFSHSLTSPKNEYFHSRTIYLTDISVYFAYTCATLIPHHCHRTMNKSSTENNTDTHADEYFPRHGDVASDELETMVGCGEKKGERK